MSTSSSRLKPNCLNFYELLAQNIALISPTMTAALIVPVMYSNTGDWSWLSYALGTVMLLFVAYNLNQFARRSTTSGSMYAYTCRGLGLTAGGICGWALIWAYLGISMAGVHGFSIFADTLLGMMGIHVPFIALAAVCVAIGGYCAWKNVQLSLMLTLILEGISMTFILILCAIVLFDHKFAFDSAQVTVSALPWGSVGLGVVVAVFSLVGFESSTAFGDEAKSPLKSIPRSVNLSLVISGLFFMFVTYIEVMGTRGYSTTLDQIDAPLNVLATLSHVPILQIPLSLGAMLSFFALCMSCLNAGGRVIYAMGRHGIFHASTAYAHEKNETPHIAVIIMSVLAFGVPTAMNLGGIAPLDGFNYVGTCAAFGFIVAYGLVTVAAPVYLKRLGELTGKDVAACGAAVILLAIPAVGSVYPIPDPPVSYFPYGFLVYLAIGIVWIMSVYKRTPKAAAAVQADLDRSHARV
jgi:amino acid transporter